MKMTAKLLAGLIFVIIFGGIALTAALGWWQTTTTKVPVKFAAGEAAGEYNPADIRGSYKFGDISRLFEIPLAELQTAFHFPPGTDPAEYQVKSLEAQFADQAEEIGTNSVRLFVAFYRGLPFDLTDEIYLPLAAVDILKQKAALTAEQIAYLDSHTVRLAGAELSAPSASNTPQPATPATPAPTAEPGAAAPAATEHAAPQRTITGKTTFQELLDWGVSQAAIEQVIGGAMPDPATVIRDYYSAKGAEFGTAKTELQALVK